MNPNESSAISKQRSSVKKRKFQPVSFMKKLRSKIPRRKRFHISPFLGESSSNSVLFGENNSESSVFPVVSSSSSFPDEISSSSNWIPVGSENINKLQLKTSRRKRQSEITGGISRFVEKIPGRRVTRSYYKQKLNESAIEKGNGGGELSETYSCVESFSGAAEAQTLYKSEEFSELNLKLRSRIGKVAEQAGESDGDAASAAVISLSGTSCIQPISQEKSKKTYKSDDVSGETSIKRAKKSVEFQGDDVYSETSFLKFPSEMKYQNINRVAGDSMEMTTEKDEENRAPEVSSFSEISRNYVELNFESTANGEPNEFEFDNYARTLSYEEGSDDSSIYRMALSDLDSDIFPCNSDLEFSDYTQSLFESQSDSEFSEGDSTPTAYFSFFVQYTKQFFKLSRSPPDDQSNIVQEDYRNEFTLDDDQSLRFEDENYEESYKMFRSRERREVVLRNYMDEYYSTTEYGDLVFQQRLLMVSWILEESNVRELKLETRFLGVNLLDRCLSQGFFKKKKKLQLLGIACLTLATRLEENQPFNCVRQRTIQVGSNVYSRCEVVAMEWLVQEVLQFKCYIPTTYNFLWFYLEAAKADEAMEETAKYMAILSLLDNELLRFWPSTIAAGLVTLTAIAANQDPSFLWVIKTHIRNKIDDLAECMQSLEWLVKYVRR